MSAAAFIRITRPHNAVVAGLTALIGYLVATGTLTPPTLLLAVAVGLITAAGNVINDVYDVEIDRINRPDRPIPAGLISLGGAKAYTVALFAGGLLAAALTTALCFAIALANVVVLVAYAVRLKRTPGIGNLAVAYLTASVFLFGGAFAGVEGLVQNLTLAGITFLATIAREVLKDAEDVDGDAAGGARTLPMLIGVQGRGGSRSPAASLPWRQASSRRVTGGDPSTSPPSRLWTPSSSMEPSGGRGARRRPVSGNPGRRRSCGRGCLRRWRSLRLPQ